MNAVTYFFPEWAGVIFAVLFAWGAACLIGLGLFAARQLVEGELSGEEEEQP